MTDIFTSKGAIRTDIDPTTIPPDRRAQYVALVVAQTACERAESDEKAANDVVAQAVREHDRAQAALPRSTFLDEWKRSVG